MKIKLFDKVLYRAPQFPVNATLEDCWPELKASIKNASSYFYGIVKDLAYDDIEKQSPSIQHTIAQYFNRAKHRATPYGTFAGIGVCPIKKDVGSALVIAAEKQVHRFPDWKSAESLRHSCKAVWQE